MKNLLHKTQAISVTQDMYAGFGAVRLIVDQVQTLSPRFVAVNEGTQTRARAAGQISDSTRPLNETAQQSAA